MKGEITKYILEAVSGTVSSIPDLIEAILQSGYGASSRKIQRNFEKIKSSRTYSSKKTEQLEKQRYYNLIYQLKRDGLIAEDKEKDSKIKKLRLTLIGTRKLDLLRRKLKKIIPAPRYEEDSNGEKQVPTVTIVIFDVPEQYRSKRYWLREALRNIGLKMVQKSVWLGKVKIPKQFLSDIGELKLAGYVQIFEVTKSGSLTKLI